MSNPINLILSIIEQPTAKKPYEDFAKYLKSINRTEEADAMLLLAERRAKHEPDSSSSG
ncbi:MAG: hypothetical protein M0R80_02960 [Proteobacteria bacterium]|jgi:hypothetical protein|nr:hypothetical protein [Pseudomonadota bacterium]